MGLFIHSSRTIRKQHELQMNRVDRARNKMNTLKADLALWEHRGNPRKIRRAKILLGNAQKRLSKAIEKSNH